MPKRKPTAMLELSGAFQKNPSRRRDGEPQPSGPLGDPPARLTPEERLFWWEIEADCAKGVLTVSDRWAVELAARAMAKIAAGTAKGFDYGLLKSLLGSMGMTPTDRSKLSVPAEKPVNRFLALKNESERPN